MSKPPSDAISGRSYPLPPHPSFSFSKFCPMPHQPMLFLLLFCFGWICKPKIFESWYCNTSSTLLCALCNRVSSLLKVQQEWDGFSQSRGFRVQNHWVAPRLTHPIHIKKGHFFLKFLVLWFEITHINTQDTNGPVYWCTFINIYWHYLLYAQSSYLYCSYWYKNLFYRGPQCLHLSKITHL